MYADTVTITEGIKDDKMSRARYTEKQLIQAVSESKTYSEIMRKLGLKPNGGNHSTIKQKIAVLNLDVSHFPPSWNAGQTFHPKRPIEDYLNNLVYIHSYKLKLRLIKEGYFLPECSNCKLTNWLGNPIPLELHHIDGNRLNNNLSNLQLLCPNCHSLTDNFCGKNKAKCV